MVFHIRGLGLALLLAACAQATVITSFTGGLTGADPNQLNRMNRNGVASDWSSSKPFPGVLTTGSGAGLHAYHTYSIPIGLENFIQISVDDPSTITFAAAYQTAYVLNGSNQPSATNYLGDMGTSGNLVTNDPNFFQVIAAQNSTLILVFNEISTGAGIGQPFGVLVEGFLDSNFTELPEPSSIGLVVAGLAMIAIVRARKGRRAEQA